MSTYWFPINSLALILLQYVNGPGFNWKPRTVIGGFESAHSYYAFHRDSESRSDNIRLIHCNSGNISEILQAGWFTQTEGEQCFEKATCWNDTGATWLVVRVSPSEKEELGQSQILWPELLWSQEWVLRHSWSWPPWPLQCHLLHLRYERNMHRPLFPSLMH